MIILSGSICLDDIPKDKITKSKNGKRYLNISQYLNNDLNNYGNHGSIYVKQNQSEIDSKANMQFIGNSKVVFTDGVMPNVAERNNNAPQQQTTKQVVEEEEESDLPF